MLKTRRNEIIKKKEKAEKSEKGRPTFGVAVVDVQHGQLLRSVPVTKDAAHATLPLPTWPTGSQRKGIQLPSVRDWLTVV